MWTGATICFKRPCLTQDLLSRNVDMLSTGVGKHLWYSLNFICYISYVAACVHVHSRGALGLTTPSQPSSCCFQTQTTRRAGFTSSSGPWLLPWRQEPPWQEVWRLYSVRLTNFINVNNHWIGYILVQGHPWRVGLVQVLRKQHHRWWERLCIISDSSEIMEGCKKSKRLSDTTQIRRRTGLPVLTAFFAAAIVYYLHERSMREGVVVVVVVEGSTGRQSFIALAQPCPHLRQSSYRFSLWNANCPAVFGSGTIWTPR